MPGVAKAHHGGEVVGGGAWRPKFRSDPVRSDPIQYDPTRGIGEGGRGAGGKVLEHARQELRVCVCV